MRMRREGEERKKSIGVGWEEKIDQKRMGEEDRSEGV